MSLLEYRHLLTRGPMVCRQALALCWLRAARTADVLALKRGSLWMRGKLLVIELGREKCKALGIPGFVEVLLRNGETHTEHPDLRRPTGHTPDEALTPLATDVRGLPRLQPHAPPAQLHGDASQLEKGIDPADDPGRHSPEGRGIVVATPIRRGPYAIRLDDGPRHAVPYALCLSRSPWRQGSNRTCKLPLKPVITATIDLDVVTRMSLRDPYHKADMREARSILQGTHACWSPLLRNTRSRLCGQTYEVRPDLKPLVSTVPATLSLPKSTFPTCSDCVSGSESHMPDPAASQWLYLLILLPRSGCIS